ncbi:hypothetical protein BDFB_011426 [Asbolus verrucosus]|uniref:Uncharacterized protein n=1 Tax=Asbolus verrucosus TaxID=1661398 RepID=A0A482VF06_ASBVE|nr:hypothetical protein BDFB_011426 [Asbolus verrucosus]
MQSSQDKTNGNRSKKTSLVRLVDGNATVRSIYVNKLNITLNNKVIPTIFIALPNSQRNHTLSGIDFIEEFQIESGISHRCYHFVDNPDEKTQWCRPHPSSNYLKILLDGNETLCNRIH